MDLSLIPPCLRAQAIEGLKNDDILQCLFRMDSEKRIVFVSDNMYHLLDLGYFEEALLNAFVDMKPDRFYFSFDLIWDLFLLANTDELINCGDPLPVKQDTYTLYRGISGDGSIELGTRPRSLERGLSWTSSFDVAKWFAKRGNSYNPTVYMAQVPRKNIFAYINDRNEEEFICDITDDIRLVEVWRYEEEITEMEPSTAL